MSDGEAMCVDNAFDECRRQRGRYAGKIKAALVLLCAVISTGLMFNIAVSLLDAYLALSGGATDANALLYLVVVNAGNVLDAALLLVFVTFAYSIIHHAAFFSRRQSLRLVAIAVILLVEVLLKLLIPMIVPPAAGVIAAMSEVATPTLDLRLLSFALVFFALAGIFEYGRILQEESDSFI